MNEVNSITFIKILSSHVSLAAVISSSIGSPTPEKILQILQSYEEAKEHLIGAFFGQRLIAVVGFTLTEAKAIIRHISVLSDFQKQKIGKQLIGYVIKHFSVNHVNSETDNDSVGFYKSLGFTCHKFKGLYNARYSCALNI